MPAPRSPPRRRFLRTACASTVISLIASPHESVQSATAATAANAAIEQLIADMTLEEKAGQLSLYWDPTRPDAANVNPAALELSKAELMREIARGHVGALYNGIGVAGARELQRHAVEQSRLKIPLLFAADVIHGLRTVFPVPLAEAAAFDLELAERTARAAAVEATAMGIQWTFAPVVDIARDQRWGRVVEGAGEDTYLGRQLAAARVRGFQGPDLRRDDSMLATMKHFAAYGAVVGGMEYNSVDIPETTLREVHLPPFKAGIDAGALSVMSSFNDVLGVPATANRHLLSDILRGEWGFRGLVVSDYTSEQELVAHGVAVDDKDAARQALLAGCDMSMQSGIYLKHLPALVREGSVPMAALDQAVRRVLGVKQALGLFDNPYRSLDAAKEQTRVRMPAAVALAREAARRSVVLLKNEGMLLPLRRQGQRVALIGPFGVDREHLLGPWSIWGDAAHAVSLEQGLRAAMADPSLLEIAKGCDIEAPIEGGIAAAVAVARRADVVLLALGEGQHMAGEAAARVDIGLPAAQGALAEAVAATGKPVVVILRHGRALALTGAVRDARSIVAAWFLGSESGHALADLIFGDYSPSGRLPVSFPQASGQQPYFYNHRGTGRPQVNPAEAWFKSRYREVSHAALYPFGHGLTYGDAVYGATTAAADRLPWDGKVQLSATITNRGSRAVREMAQLYIRQRVASLTRPVRELKAFQAVELGPGESRTVSFPLTRDDLAFVRADLALAAEPGTFEVTIAPSATGGVGTVITLGAA